MKLTQAGIDIGKNVSQIHYIDAASGEIINRPLKRVALLKYFANRGPFLYKGMWWLPTSDPAR